MNKSGKIAIIAVVALALVFSVGFALAKPQGGGAKECNNGLDDDGDGAVDLADAGCVNKGDKDESNCGDGVCEGGETQSSCSADCTPAQVCGNNVQEGTEVCDGTDLAGESCGSQGFDGGSLACAGNCGSFDTSGCWTNTCTDTDGGFAPFVAGGVFGEFEGVGYNLSDVCSGDVLNERYCASGQALNFTYNCADNQTSSCVSGACV